MDIIRLITNNKICDNHNFEFALTITYKNHITNHELERIKVEDTLRGLQTYIKHEYQKNGRLHWHIYVKLFNTIEYETYKNSLKVFRQWGRTWSTPITSTFLASGWKQYCSKDEVNTARIDQQKIQDRYGEYNDQYFWDD